MMARIGTSHDDNTRSLARICPVDIADKSKDAHAIAAGLVRYCRVDHGALLEPLWNLSENIHVHSLIVETKLMHNFNDLMWWAHKDSNLGPAD
jgi:hypothetical protein